MSGSGVNSSVASAVIALDTSSVTPVMTSAPRSAAAGTIECTSGSPPESRSSTRRSPTANHSSSAVPTATTGSPMPATACLAPSSTLSRMVASDTPGASTPANEHIATPATSRTTEAAPAHPACWRTRDSSVPLRSVGASASSGEVRNGGSCPAYDAETARVRSCATPATAIRARIVTALNHAKGRSKPHQNGAHMRRPATVTTTPAVRGTRSKAPPTASTRHAPKNASCTRTVTLKPWASNGPLPYVGLPSACQIWWSCARCHMAGTSNPPKPTPLTRAQEPARRRAHVADPLR